MLRCCDWAMVLLHDLEGWQARITSVPWDKTTHYISPISVSVNSQLCATYQHSIKTLLTVTYRIFRQFTDQTSLLL